MGKATKLVEVEIDKLIPYASNAKTHDSEQVKKLKASIETFGFLSPCLIDKDLNIIAGHGRVMAAREAGMLKIPCLYIEGLTEDERKAYIIADNRLTELGGWDLDILSKELKDLNSHDFDIDLTGFDSVDELSFDFGTEEVDDDEELERKRKEFEERMEAGEDLAEDEDYQAFCEKFEAKKTTDDCYTPPEVYEVVADYVANTYHLNRKNFVRPFYPGGDYQSEKYKKTDVVVDNPPFSILSEIIRFYADRGIKFFLFAPALTLLNSAATEKATCLCVNAPIIYENGASVSTSFVTNLEPEDICLRSAPDLHTLVDDTVKAISTARQVPTYQYPPNVITAPMVGRLSKYHTEYTLRRSESCRISALEAQKEVNKGIFGGGFLISEKAAAEKATAEKAAAEKATAEKAAAENKDVDSLFVWKLSKHEKEIIADLSKNDQPTRGKNHGKEKSARTSTRAARES